MDGRIQLATEQEALQLVQAIRQQEATLSVYRDAWVGWREVLNNRVVTSYYYGDAIHARLEAACAVSSYHSRTTPLRRHSGFVATELLSFRSAWLNALVGKPSADIALIVIPETSSILDERDLDALRTQILHPELFSGVKIGSGSEGDVYRYTIAGNVYAVKIFSPEGQAFAESLAWGFRKFPTVPHFARTLGFAEEFISTELRGWPMEGYRLSTLREYAASASFLIMELGPEIGVDDLYAFYSRDKARRRECKPQTQSYIEQWGVLREDVERLSRSIAALDALGRLLTYLCRGACRIPGYWRGDDPIWSTSRRGGGLLPGEHFGAGI